MKNPYHFKKPNLYLVGFMGVGKSVVGRGVAKQLGYRFVDSDRCIEKAQGRSISQIFEEDGESAFRVMERAFIESGHPDQGHVVACGGGLVVPEGMVELLESKGVVICLFASAETIYQRTSKTHKRPLLQVEDPLNQIETLMAERMPVYQSFGMGVSTDNRPLADVIAHVIRIYQASIEEI